MNWDEGKGVSGKKRCFQGAMVALAAFCLVAGVIVQCLPPMPLGIPAGSDTAYADESRATKWREKGECVWRIEDGCLVIKPTNGVSGYLDPTRTSGNKINWGWKSESYSSVRIEPGVFAHNCNSMFYKEVQTESQIYRGNSDLVSVDLSGLNTSNVCDMANMFWGCSSLTSLDLSTFDTSKVEDMANMFSGCSSLASLDLSTFDTSKVGNRADTSTVGGMSGMFGGCSSLASLDLSSFDTSNVKDMSYMFRGCSSLASLDLSSFDTSSVEEMRRMFDSCSSIVSLDLSSFDMSKVNSSIKMFSDCPKLERVYVGPLFSHRHEGLEFSDKIGPAIVGGLGTRIEDVSPNSTSVDSLWFRPDVPGSPGLLTLKKPKTIAVTDAEASPLPAYEYTGGAIKPSVSLVYNDRLLVDGVDYALSYEDNVEPGVASVIVEGKGSYSGYKRVPFVIEDPSSKINLSGAKVVLSQDRYEYDGEVKRPEVVVSFDGGNLAEGEDYAVAYSSNVDAGTAKVTVTGKGGFTGTAVVSFVIDPAPLSRAGISCLPASFVYDGVQKKPEVIVSFGEKMLAEEEDYVLSYTDNVEAGSALVTVEGRGNYRDAVQVVFAIEPCSLSGAQVSMSQTSYVYDGSAKRPSVAIKLNDKTLTQGRDYSVSYTDNVAVGTAQILITGKGNYAGSCTAAFTIQQQAGGDGHNPEKPETPSKPSEPGDPNAPNDSNKPSGPSSAADSGAASGSNQGSASSNIPVAPDGSWKHDSVGWWYAYDKGGYPANGWMSIGGAAYFFDTSGYMQTGWVRVDGVWYYLDSSGARAEGWRYVGGEWYWLRPGSGAMATGWVYTGGSWYWLENSGAMATGWKHVGGEWYYLDPSGAMAEGWRYVGGEWYWLRPVSGAMATGWVDVDGTWYWMRGSGAMDHSGWLSVGGEWYWLEDSGAMATGWKHVGGEWYYLKASGAMATGWAQVSGAWYYLDGSGAMATGWRHVGGAWYYLYGSGAMAASAWVDGVYWVGPSGAMATSSWVDSGRYYVGPDGVWQP